MRFYADVHVFSNNSLVTTLLTVTKSFYFVSALASFGFIFAAAFLVREERGFLTKEGLRVKKLAHLATFVTLVTVIGSILVELANLLGGSLLDAFDATTIRSFIYQTSLGRFYFAQFIFSFVVLLIVQRAKKTGALYGATVLSMVGMLAPVFQSHSSSGANHASAIGSLLFHVLFLALWVGGVFGLIVISPEERRASIHRFSAVALWSAIFVALTGAINAWTRLNFLAAWHSRYGFLVALKIILTAILIGFGALHRRNLRNNGAEIRTFRLLLNESLVMIGTVVIGSWLSSTHPPVLASTQEASVDLVKSFTGSSMPLPPSAWRILTAYVPDGAFLGLLIIATALYMRGVLLLNRRGDHWPIGRIIAFFTGIAFADFATSGGIGIYANVSFSYHMISHMILGMVAPIGFVLSAPITLALRVLPAGRTEAERGLRGSLVAIIHSRYSVIMTNPVTALAIFDGSLFALYLTPLFGILMRSHSGHLLMDIHFVLSGYLFFYVIIGVDVNPKKIPHIVRIIVLFAAMSIHAFFSITLLSTSSLVDGGYFALLQRPWNTNLLSDQHAGGAIGWAMGEIPILLAIVATFLQWIRDDKKEARRIDRAAERADAMGMDDELAQYNKYLRDLNAREPRD